MRYITINVPDEVDQEQFYRLANTVEQVVDLWDNGVSMVDATDTNMNDADLAKELTREAVDYAESPWGDDPPRFVPAARKKVMVEE